MVNRAAAFALSGAALVATASSFVAPPLLASSRPLGALSSSSAHTSKLSPDAGRSRRSRRAGGAKMSTVEGGASQGEVTGGERYYGPTSKPLLDSVQSPADMKRFTIAELKQLAYELRWETLEVCEKNLSTQIKKKTAEPVCVVLREKLQQAPVCALSLAVAGEVLVC